MSFDLYLCQRLGQHSSQEQLKSFFKGRKHFEVQDLRGEGFQAWYQNPSTGVYFSFDSAEEDKEEILELPDDFGEIRVFFNINFSRPSFFALEAMPVIELLAQELGFLVVDPQESLNDNPALPQKCDAEALIESWTKHNAAAVRTLHLSSPGTGYAYLSRESALYWWSYMRSKEKTESELLEDVFVPDIILMKHPQFPHVRTAVLWSDALPQLFPVADYVIQNIVEDDGTGKRRSKELRLLRYADVMKRLEGMLRPMQTEAATVAYLPERSVRQIRNVFNQLHGPVFEEYQLIGPDKFVDVYLPEKFGSAIQ